MNFYHSGSLRLEKPFYKIMNITVDAVPMLTSNFSRKAFLCTSYEISDHLTIDTYNPSKELSSDYMAHWKDVFRLEVDGIVVYERENYNFFDTLKEFKEKKDKADNEWGRGRN